MKKCGHIAGRVFYAIKSPSGEDAHSHKWKCAAIRVLLHKKYHKIWNVIFPTG